MEVFISEEQLKNRIQEMGEMITRDYEGIKEDIVIVGILNGAFMFCADLVRNIKTPVIVEFMAASSYGSGMETSGTVEIRMDLQMDVKGKHVLFVEDIVDTGLTLKKVMEMMKDRGALSVKLASLLSKPARRQHEVQIDYLGFEIEDKFVVGYGLDLAGKFREIPYIGLYNS